MKLKLTARDFIFLLVGIFATGSPVEFAAAQPQGVTFSGRVQRVWEDGFQLNSGNRSITVDAYDLFGDNTIRYVTVREQVMIIGEFESGEFDAFSITKASGERVCR